MFAFCPSCLCVSMCVCLGMFCASGSGSGSSALAGHGRRCWRVRWFLFALAFDIFGARRGKRLGGTLGAMRIYT